MIEFVAIRIESFNWPNNHSNNFKQFCMWSISTGKSKHRWCIQIAMPDEVNEGRAEAEVELCRVRSCSHEHFPQFFLQTLNYTANLNYLLFGLVTLLINLYQCKWDWIPSSNLDVTQPNTLYRNAVRYARAQIAVAASVQGIIISCRRPLQTSSTLPYTSYTLFPRSALSLSPFVSSSITINYFHAGNALFLPLETDIVLANLNGHVIMSIATSTFKFDFQKKGRN